MLDTRISDLPYIPGVIDPAATKIELAYPDVSSDTGLTSVYSFLSDVLAFVPTPSVGNGQVAYGSPIDGSLTSSALLTYNDIIATLGLNMAGAAIVLNDINISDATDRLNISKGNISLGEYVGVPSIAAMFMAQTPGANNYILAGTAGGASYFNGNSLQMAINGSVKGITNASYTQYTQPFAVGSIAPIGSNAFVVGGETYMKGISASGSDYIIKTQNSTPTDLFSLANNGVQVNRSILDGTGSGNDNFSWISTNGGVKNSFYSQTGSNSSHNFYTNNVLGSQHSEISGYYQTSVQNRFSLKSIATAKSHFYMDASTGFCGFGDDYTVAPAYPLDLRNWYGVNPEQLSFFNGYNIGMSGTTIYNRNPQPSGQPFRWQTDSIDGIGMSSAAGGQMGFHIGNNALAAQGGILTVGHSGATTNIINCYNAAGTSIFRVKQSGNFAMPSAQVGNAGLASGDLYFDTAANVLANGDLIAARKV